MPDRYWVGGTASWDGTAGTKWSATSGGPGGAAVPTSADDVFFDAASGVGTVTIATGNTGAKSINCTGFTGTITGTAAIAVAGSITLVAAMTYTHTGTVTFSGTGTLTTAGKAFSGVTVNGAGVTLTLGDALNTETRSINITQGTFDTANYSVTASGISSPTTITRTINLGSSTVTLTGNSVFGVLTTGLTFNAGTSTIVLTGNLASFDGFGLTFHNFSLIRSNTLNFTINGANTFNNVSFTGGGAGIRTIASTNTFNDLSVSAPSSAGIIQIAFSGRQTINGTLSTTGTAGNRRVWFRSTTHGLSQVLVVNSAASLTDADFRDIIVTGTAAPISGTRIGDLRGNTGITFSAPKTVFRIGTGNWSADQWSGTSGGGVSTDNFPLAQDTAVFNNSTTAGTHTMDSAVPYCGTVDMSARTSALTLSLGTSQTVYGNWINGSGTTISGGVNVTFSGRNTQIITSAGKLFGNIGPIIDSYGGTVELADAFSSGSGITVANGTFDTKSYNVTVPSFGLLTNDVKIINLGSSVVTLGTPATALNFRENNTNFTLIPGTSTIILSAGSATFTGGGQTFNNVSFTSTSAGTHNIIGANTFNNLTLTTSASAGLRQLTLAANQTVNGTFTCAGSSVIRRVFVRSDIIGTSRTITAAAISADDCDFRDITIASAAAGTTPTRAGDCGNNSGITFPAAKTVYRVGNDTTWVGSSSWALTSGGTGSNDNFPLAQDTVIINNDTTLTGTLSNATYNVGILDCSSRTTGITLSYSVPANYYGSHTFGSGVTISGTLTQQFVGRGIMVFTCAGKTITFPITVEAPGTFQLGDAFSSSSSITHFFGTFNANNFNLTCTAFNSNISNTIRTITMGSGLWTLTGTGSVWGPIGTPNLTFNKNTADILLTDITTTSRTFNGSGLSYNKLTIGGATGISTTTISDTNQFTELASTKTVAHTIALGTTAQTFGAWTVTGTVGNVVTLTGTGTSHNIVGAATSGIDYLAMGSIGFAATSPGEFYAGVNSTGTATAPVYRTAKPADSTRYWVGGTGNWSDTARWSTGSGGLSGASVPRSHDDVVFDSLSNATAYTATVNAVTGGIRCKALTIAGPAAGNVTLAGSATFNGIHGDVTLPATGLTRTYTGDITLSGSTTGRTLTTNGVVLGSAINIDGVGCEWSLGSALSQINAFIRLRNGVLDSAGYNITSSGFSVSENSTSFLLGSSSVIFNNNGPLFHAVGGATGRSLLFTFDAGTSSITFSGSSVSLNWNTQITFHNVTFSDTSAGFTNTLSNANATFNNLTVATPTNAGLRQVVLRGDVTVNGTFTCNGASAIQRGFVRSNTIGTTRTITAAVVSVGDCDFRDITIAGAAAPVSGTRLGDCKGNSGITFDAAKTVYWNLAAGGNWSATGWATGSGGTPNVNNFPLAQDTAVFEATGLNSGATVTINASFNVGTIDMSARTSSAMTLATGSSAPQIYGNWINGTGTTLTGSGNVNFAGRGSQTITSAGRTFLQPIYFDVLSGSVTLQDSITLNTGVISLSLVSGTFNTNNFSVAGISGGSGFTATGSITRILNMGSSTWTFVGAGGVWTITNSTNLTVTGTGTINLTSSSAKTFNGGSLDYSGITLNNGGAGALTITGDNRFKDLTATRTATSAATISLGTTTQRLSQFSGSGQAGRLLTITGTSATSPATLIFTGTGIATNAAVDYLTLIGIRAYPTTDTWYAGDNSITTASTGTLGWIYAAFVAPSVVTSGNFLMFAMP